MLKHACEQQCKDRMTPTLEPALIMHACFHHAASSLLLGRVPFNERHVNFVDVEIYIRVYMNDACTAEAFCVEVGAVIDKYISQIKDHEGMTRAWGSRRFSVLALENTVSLPLHGCWCRVIIRGRGSTAVDVQAENRLAAGRTFHSGLSPPS